MRKFVTLITFVTFSLFSIAVAQTSLEADITTAVLEAGAEGAYAELISADSEILNQEQKDALAALGAEAGAAFLNAVANGSTFNDAAVIAVTTAGATNDSAGELVAKLTSSPTGTGTEDTSGQFANNNGENSELQTETAAGPDTTTGTGTGTGTGTTTPVGGGTNGGGSGGGGVTASGN